MNSGITSDMNSAMTSATSSEVSHECRFIAEIEGIEFAAGDIEALLLSLNAWFDTLSADIRRDVLAPTGLGPNSTLRRQADAINQWLSASVGIWSKQWIKLEPARALARSFDNQVLLLVFGKFNAGKSTFCNVLADRFAAYGKAVSFFHIDAGRVVESAEHFKEGATETTSRLQGVRLGENLVLLDTPGLHSVTPENAALTQRFTDSADGVLWLTSSTSPGQVQELDGLARELHRNKPLLPVLTRSDEYEEDEIDGQIVKQLRNKSATNRALQEADVKTRAQEKLVAMGIDPALLKPPVSISAYVARTQKQTMAAMTEAGFENIYAALLAVTEPALAYKERKHAEILLHHLEENVLGALQSDVLPLLTGLDACARTVLDTFAQQQDRLMHVVWRGVAPMLPALLDKHAMARDLGAIGDEVSHIVWEKFSDAVDGLFDDYVVSPQASLGSIRVDDAAYEDIVVAHASPGANVDEVIGVDHGRLHMALSQAIRDALRRLSDDVIDQCRDSVIGLIDQVKSLVEVLEARHHDLQALKREIQSGSVRHGTA